MKNLPSNRASRDSRAREQTRQFRVISPGKPHHSRSCSAGWTFSDHTLKLDFNRSEGRAHAYPQPVISHLGNENYGLNRSRKPSPQRSSSCLRRLSGSLAFCVLPVEEAPASSSPSGTGIARKALVVAQTPSTTTQA